MLRLELAHLRLLDEMQEPLLLHTNESSPTRVGEGIQSSILITDLPHGPGVVRDICWPGGVRLHGARSTIDPTCELTEALTFLFESPGHVPFSATHVHGRVLFATASENYGKPDDESRKDEKILPNGFRTRSWKPAFMSQPAVARFALRMRGAPSNPP